MRIIKTEHLWLETEKIPTVFKNEFELSDEETKTEIFQEFLPFGTGGMRGLMGLGPNRINNITIARAAYGFGKLLQSLGTKMPKIVIGYDNRNGSQEFAQTSAKVLSAMGCKAYLFEELMATPIVSFAIRDLEAQGGIIITASHNPPVYNGFKVYDETGCQLLPHHIKKVTTEIDTIVDIFTIAETTENIISLDKHYIHRYIKKLAEYSGASVAEKKLHIGFSPQHGTALKPVEEIFKKFNYPNYYIVKEQATVDGNFPNTKNPNPEDPVSFELLKKYGQTYNLDILATTDPDADRLGIAYRTEDGQYTQLTGNQVGALLIDFYIKKKNVQPARDYIVKTIVTAELGATIARAYGVEVVEVLTGFKYIGDVINQKGEAGFIAGYEESYGYLLYPFTRDKDGLQILLAVAEMADVYKAQGKTLGNRLTELAEKYGYFQERLLSFDLVGVDGMQEMKEMYDKMKKLEWDDISIKEDYEIGKRINITEQKEQTFEFERAKVLKFYLGKDDWFCIRPSGTEPKLKIYLGIKKDTEIAAKVAIETLESRLISYLKK